jgi:hypothetical protein
MKKNNLCIFNLFNVVFPVNPAATLPEGESGVEKVGFRGYVGGLTPDEALNPQYALNA